MRELADGLIARGHRPRLVTSHPGATSRSIEDGLPIVRHRRPPDGPLRRLGLEHYLTHAPASYVSLARAEDDLAQAVFVSDALAAGLWSDRTGKPSVFSYMGIPDRPGLAEPRLRLRLTRAAVQRCSAVTALSRPAAEAFERELGVSARVIPPGVDVAAFRPAPVRAGAPTIVCSADVTAPRKRVGLLVEAFTRVRRARPAARLVLSRPHDAAIAATLSGEPGVELADLDERSALARAYGSAWVSALPSLGEAFGLVLAEALACGTPVVATDTGGMRDVVDDRSIGRLFSGGPDDLAHALLGALELLEDPATPARCRRRGEDFSVERCVDAHERLYRELLDRG